MDTNVTIDDSVQGKNVVDANGEVIGKVTSVRGDTAYVDPDPGMTEKIMSKLGWDDIDREDYPLRGDSIQRIDDDKIYLRQDF